MKYYELIEEIKKLDLESKEELKELIEKIILQERRKEILSNYKKSLEELRKNKLNFYSNLKELKKELKS